MYNRVYVVGVGGVGSNLAAPLARLLSYAQKKGEDPKSLTFIDGDNVEPKNLKRQDFTLEDVGKTKAEAILQAISVYGGELDLSFEPVYVDKDNIKGLIEDDSIIIMGVDNNQTKHLVQEYCLGLKNVVLVSGGNETYDGDVTVYWRKDGKEMTPPLWNDQPNIKNPTDEHPKDQNCTDTYTEDPQLFATNFTVAASILDVVTPVLMRGEPLIQQLFFDIRTGNRVNKWTLPYVEAATMLLKKVSE